MCRLFSRTASFGLLASTLVALALGTSAQAFTINDSGDTVYWGGLRNGAATTSDVIGSTAAFEVTSMDVNVLGTGGGTNNLEVVIHTVFNPYTAGAVGTGFGSLFIGSSAAQPLVLAGASPWASDTYSADPGRFNYVFSIPTNPAKTLPTDTTVSGAGSLIPLLGTGTDVQTSYFPDPPDTGPSNSFRQDQAVGYLGSATPTLFGTFTFDEIAGTLTFLIVGENGLLGDLVTFAWAMTCANDVIIGVVPLPPRGEGTVPLPAGFLLMGSVLFGAGGIAGWRRRRRVARAA